MLYLVGAIGYYYDMSIALMPPPNPAIPGHLTVQRARSASAAVNLEQHPDDDEESQPHEGQNHGRPDCAHHKNLEGRQPPNDEFAGLDPRAAVLHGRVSIRDGQGYVADGCRTTYRCRRGPTVVPIPSTSASLPNDSVAVCHQVTTLDRSKLSQLIGTLPPTLLREVGQALKASMDLE